MAIPKCKICKEEMSCLKNGIEVIFKGELLPQNSCSILHQSVIDKLEIGFGNGDLFKCKKCGTFAVDGFNVLIGSKGGGK